MSLLVPWLLFPATLGILALGCGLLLERITTGRLPGALIAPAGLSVIVVAASFLTHAGASARLTVPAIVGLATAGLVCGIGRVRVRQVAVPLAAAVIVFGAYAAPVALSGQATFAGYIELDDTATFLALTDRVMEHGPNTTGLAPSSYEAALSINLANGYPVGALLPLGVGQALVGVDAAWLYQPYLAFAATLLALVLYVLAGSVVRSRGLRAVASVVAAQPALLYGYALWGGIKELVAAPLVALVAALGPTLSERSSNRLRLLPLATAAAAAIAVLSVGGIIWFIAPTVVVAVLAARNRQIAERAAILAGAFLLLSLPALLDARSFLDPATEAAVRSGTELGNLVRPLNPAQVFGVWPAGDFRFQPSDGPAAWILVAATGLTAVLGIRLAWQRRAAPVLLYAAAASVACALMLWLGSPWIVAKAYAMASPAFVLAALVGCAGLLAGTRRTEGVVGLAAVAGGVLWSNALAYHDVNLAPKAQLAELEQIGHRFRGEGPALMTEYQPYGVRHFLRDLDAEGASELRRRPVPLRNGSMLDKGAYADLSEFRRSAVLVYKTLVLRRSPVASQPGTPYRLSWRGRYYDVWQQTSSEGALAANTRPRCVRHSPLVVRLGAAAFPSNWRTSTDSSLLFPSGEGRVRAPLRLSHGGRYSIWIGGSFRNRLSASVDGRLIGRRSNQLNNAGQYTHLGDVRLRSGTHVAELRYEASPLRPGSGGPEYGLGPLVVSSAAAC